MLLKKLNDKKKALYIDEFKIKDSTEDKHLIVFEEGDSSRYVFAKNSRKVSRFHLATTKNIRRIRWFAPNLIVSKPNITRRKKCDSINNGYAIIGMRPDRLTLENGVYMSFKKNIQSRLSSWRKLCFA